MIFCKGQLFSATATCKWGKCPWFSKREDIKALLNMDSCWWHFPDTCMDAQFPKSPFSFHHCWDVLKQRRPTAPCFQPSPWCPACSPLAPAMAPQPEPAHPPQLHSPKVLLGPLNLSSKAGLGGLQKFSLDRQLHATTPHLGLVAEELHSMVFTNFKDKAHTHVSWTLAALY